MSIRKPQKKLYYSLRQVSDMTSLESSEVKRMEKEFPVLKPIRNRSGNRYYSDKELNLLFQIKDLYLIKKLPITEVEKQLNGSHLEFEMNETIRLKRTLAEVRLELKEIMEIFG
ncbi:MAG: MerR family transcriptional regulator [Calditrichia bacterium]